MLRSQFSLFCFWCPRTPSECPPFCYWHDIFQLICMAHQRRTATTNHAVHSCESHVGQNGWYFFIHCLNICLGQHHILWLEVFLIWTIVQSLDIPSEESKPWNGIVDAQQPCGVSTSLKLQFTSISQSGEDLEDYFSSLTSTYIANAMSMHWHWNSNLQRVCSQNGWDLPLNLNGMAALVSGYLGILVSCVLIS